MSSIIHAPPFTRLFTVEEYYRISDLGIVSPEERTELIDGEIIVMAAPNPPHVILTKLSYDYLSDLLKQKAIVRCQAPIKQARSLLARARYCYSSPTFRALLRKASNTRGYFLAH